MKIATTEQMRALDRCAVEQFAIPEEILMENAGAAVCRVLARDAGVAGRRVVIACGGGNNGGDGLVAARLLAAAGAAVRVVLLSPAERLQGAAALQVEMARRAGIELEPFVPDRFHSAAAHADVVVDAIFGTGLVRQVEGEHARAIELINRSGRPVVAVDIPSGVDGDRGRIWGCAVQATATVTFGLPKRGNLLYPGGAQAGQLWLSPISFPRRMVDEADIEVALNTPPALPARRPDGHKGSFGDALFVAGAVGYFGAPTYAAGAHLRAGGGYARLASPRSAVPGLAAVAPEVVYHPQEETAAGTLASGALAALIERAAAADFVVVGPGLSLADETQHVVRGLLDRTAAPVLVDGDGLSAVAADLDVVRRRRPGTTVLTPHPGEMARLCGGTVAEVLDDPIGRLQALCRDLGCTVVLKTARALVGFADGRVLVNTTGNSGLASAGTGDVLCGTVTAMAGLGLGVDDAVAAAVFVHGLAGDLAARALGEDGVTARATSDALPGAVAAYRRDHERLVASGAGAVLALD